MDKPGEDYAEAEELPDEVDRRLGEIETALAAFDDRPQALDPEKEDRARLASSSASTVRAVLRIERGYVPPPRTSVRSHRRTTPRPIRPTSRRSRASRA